MNETIRQRFPDAYESFRSVYCDNPNNLQRAIAALKDALKERPDSKLLSIIFLTEELKYPLDKAMLSIESSDAWR